MTNDTIDRLAAIVGLDPESAEFEAVAVGIIDLFLERKVASGRFHHLDALERWRRQRGGKALPHAGRAA